MFGETLSLAASIATINKLEREEVINQLASVGTYLHEQVDAAIRVHGMSEYISTFGHPSFRRLKFHDDKIAALFRKEMVKTGVLITASHNICAAHGPSEIKRVLRSYDHALGVLRDAIETDDIDEQLSGATVGPMVRAS